MVSARGSKKREAKRNNHILFDEILERLLDKNTQLVLDPGDVLGVVRSSVWDLIIFETFLAFIIARCAQTLRGGSVGSASGRGTGCVCASLMWSRSP